MTQDEIIRSPIGREQLVALAREAGFSDPYIGETKYELERFAALVAAHEREVLLKDNSYLAEQLQAYIHIATTVEREACAKVCEPFIGTDKIAQAERIQSAIRARSQS